MSIVQQMFDRVFAAQTPTQERVALVSLQIAQRFQQFGRAITEDQIEKWLQYAALIGVDFSVDQPEGLQTFVTSFSNAAQNGAMLPPSGAALASSNIFWDAQVRKVYRNILGREPNPQELADSVNMTSTGRISLSELADLLEQSKPVFTQASVLDITAPDYVQQVALYEQFASPEAGLLDREASIIEAERDAVLLTGALNADQDMLDQLARQEAERLALQAQEAAAQNALDVMRADAAYAYSVEVRADVFDLYRQILFREPSDSEVKSWVELVVSGSIIFEYIAPRLSQSAEAMIVGAYQQYLNRLPTPVERGNWTGSIAQGLISADQAVDAIRNSEEASIYADAIVPTPGATPLIVQTINPATGSAQAIDPIMGTSTWGTSYTNQDMIAADPVASPVVELQNYYAPDVNISSLEPVSPIGDTSPALAFKARDEIYKAYTTSLKREPSEADYQYWEPLLVAKQLSVSDFKRYVAESAEAKALATRVNNATLADQPPPEVVADLTKKTEGVGAAVGLLSALAFFLGQ